MKRIFTILACFISLSLMAALPPMPDTDRAFNTTDVVVGRLSLQTSNYGFQGDMQTSDGIKLLYKSGCWISGKRVRRDEEGRLLYWLSYPPNYVNDQYTYEGSDLWTPDLVVVQDTLTTVAYDGDRDIYELLPAYNPLLASNPEATNLYQQYNSQDGVLLSVAGTPAPLPFDPYNSETFCFSIPQPGSFETPGFQTYSAYYYDYCPFGTEGNRDWGSDCVDYHVHYPLGIAVHQESYTWNLQNHDEFIINKYTVYNTNELDSIEDLALSFFKDADIGPTSWGVTLATDDVSGYVKGPSYEFAYSRDFDGDGGLSPYYIASKLIIPGFQGWRDAWFWHVGNGPRDYNAHSLNISPGSTGNEKYWLATGRNPDDIAFVPLRPTQDEVMEYEQPQHRDTRYLHTLYGARPDMPEYWVTDDSGNYIHRINLAPQESISLYSVLFVGDSLDDLKARSAFIENFFAAGLEVQDSENLSCIPYLLEPQVSAPDGFELEWYSYNDPDHFELAIKAYGEPASNWNVINLPGNIRSFRIGELDPGTWYEIKIGSVFYNPDEIYLESDVKLVNITHATYTDDPVNPVIHLIGYPNPFSNTTKIVFDLKADSDIQLELYNLRGQKVRSFRPELVPRGLHEVNWDGRDDTGNVCANGIYYLRLKTGSELKTLKLLKIR